MTLEKIWTEFADQLHKFILSKVKDKSIADDIRQDVFIKIHSKIDTLQDPSKVQSWIYQITRNTIIDHFRKSTDFVPIVEFHDQEEENQFLEEAILDMKKYMHFLPEDYCDALCKTELKQISQKQYAKQLGISYSGAKSRVQRARKQLKTMLLNCCHYQFDKHGNVIDIFPNCSCCNPHK